MCWLSDIISELDTCECASDIVAVAGGDDAPFNILLPLPLPPVDDVGDNDVDIEVFALLSL